MTYWAKLSSFQCADVSRKAKVWNWVFLSVILMSGCSSQNDPSDHLKTFDHILTDQYIWSYGQGGIYWVSNEQVVLEARVKNEKGEQDWGLYQVDVRDGTYLKIVDISGDPPRVYKYCFDGKVFHVLKKRGIFKMVNAPKGYELVFSELGQKTDTNIYSPLRCGFVEMPGGVWGHVPLRSGDGFIKYERGEGVRNVYLVDDQGSNQKKLIDQKVKRKYSIEGMFAVNYFLEERNAYFGDSSWDSKECTELWWLYRDDLSLSNEELCLPNLTSGSKLVHSLKDALYIEHYTTKSAKSYVLKGGKQSVVEENFGRGAAVSPNGCLVAYGADLIKRGASGVRQKLKIFNYCDYQQKGQKS